MKILNFGSLNVDYTYQMPHMVRAGETLHAYSRTVNVGGKGLNQSVALARAGMDVYHAGCVGSDGALLPAFLEEVGVHTEFIRTVDVPSGHTVIQVDESGQNSILLFGGANRSVTEEQVDAVLRSFSVGDVLLLQNEINALPYLLEQAHQKGMRILLNPSPISPALLQTDLSMVNWFILNEIEAEAFTGTKVVEEMEQILLRRYPNARFVLTLGAEGARYFDGSTRYSVSAEPVQAVDTTGAGDTFTGYFFAAVLNGASVSSALQRATKAAALSVTRTGAAASIPTAEEVNSKA